MTIKVWFPEPILSSRKTRGMASHKDYFFKSLKVSQNTNPFHSPGLVPEYECLTHVRMHGQYAQQSLLSLINTSEVNPPLKKRDKRCNKTSNTLPRTIYKIKVLR